MQTEVTDSCRTLEVGALLWRLESLSYYEQANLEKAKISHEMEIMDSEDPGSRAEGLCQLRMRRNLSRSSVVASSCSVYTAVDLVMPPG